MFETCDDHPTSTVANALDLPEAGPTERQWVELFPPGPVMTPVDGRKPWRLDDASAVVEASRRVSDRLVVDYDHGSDKGASSEAAGWIERLEVRDGGIWAEVAWTPEGLAKLKGRNYRYISPVFDVTKDRGIVRILRAGLTNRPALMMTALASAAGKIAPAMKGWAEEYAASDPEGFEAYCSAAPALIGAAVATASQRKPDENGLAVHELAVCQSLGQDPKDFAAAKATIKHEEVTHDRA